MRLLIALLITIVIVLAAETTDNPYSWTNILPGKRTYSLKEFKDLIGSPDYRDKTVFVKVYL